MSAFSSSTDSAGITVSNSNAAPVLTPAAPVLPEAIELTLADDLNTPAALAELSRIKGIGPSKLEQYGTALIAVVEAASTP